jgi:hypothetical protein
MQVQYERLYWRERISFEIPSKLAFVEAVLRNANQDACMCKRFCAASAEDADQSCDTKRFMTAILGLI